MSVICHIFWLFGGSHCNSKTKMKTKEKQKILQKIDVIDWYAIYNKFKININIYFKKQ